MASRTATDTKFSEAISSNPCSCRATSRLMRSAILGSDSDSGASRSVIYHPVWLSVGAQHAAPLRLVLWLEFFYPSLMPATFKSSLQPLVQDANPLLLCHELCREHQEIRIAMLARQLRDLLVPCQRRSYLGEAVGCIRHAQSRTTREHSPLHFPAAHRLGDRLGIVRIVVRRIELLGTHIDRLVTHLFELGNEPVLEIKPDVVGSQIDLLTHRSYPIADS